MKIKSSLLGFSIGLITLVGCKNNVKTEDENSNLVPVTKVSVSNIETDLSFVADINAIQNVEIRARVNGYLEQIFVDEGKKVEKGQLLFKINDEEYKAHLLRAEANLKSAEAELKSALVEKERVRLLVEKDVITKTEMEIAMSKIDIAKAKIEEAKAEALAARVKLNNTFIKSPFTGVIDRLPFKLGSLINEGSLLTTISDISAVYAYFKISEVEYLIYTRTHPTVNDTAKGTAVSLILADGSNYPFPGKIETMESEFEEGTGTLAIRARFANPNRVLKHGSNGKVMVRRQLDSVMIIPQKSAMEIQDRNFVFLVNDQNMVEMKSFEILQRYKDFYVVKSGLKPGMRIVYEGVQNLREGSIIKPVETSMKKVYTY